MNSTKTVDFCDVNPLAAGNGGCKLVILGGNHDGENLQSRNREITIGSDPDSTFVFDRPDISALHCLIVQTQAGTVIDARQGPVDVNGQRVSNQALQPGDRIQIGNVNLLVESVGLAAATEYQPNQDAATPGKKLNPTRQVSRKRVRRLIEQLRIARETIQKQQTFLQQFCNQVPATKQTDHTTGHDRWMNMICDLDLNEIDPDILAGAIFDTQ